MKKHKILFTICTYQLAGTERQLLTLCKYLREKFDVIVACPKESSLNDKFKDLKIKVVNIGFSHIFSLKSLFGLIWVIKNENVDIVHNYLGKSAFLGTLAAMLSGIKNIITTRHFVKTYHAFSKNPFERISNLLGYKFINLLNKRLIAVSEAVRQSIIKREKIDIDKIITIYNGTDLNPKEIKESNGYKIGVVSRLSIEKGIRYLIDAMPDVLIKFPDAEYLIAGSGLEEELLKQKVNNLGLTDKVKFLGYIDDIEEFLKKIDVFVLPSLEESFGLTLVEAMVSGKPVIATKTEGAKEVIGDDSGILVEKASSKALAGAISSLFKDRELAKKLAIAGQKRATSLFSADKMARKTENLYRLLLQEKET